MVRRNGRPTWLLIVASLTALAVAAPVLAQPARRGGTVRGVVRDVKEQPVDGAVVTIVGEETGRTFTTTTNARGEFLQFGLSTGTYIVMAEKDKTASVDETVNVTQRGAVSMTLVLGAVSAAAAAEALELGAALKTLFDEGLLAGEAGRSDEAIDKFTQALALDAACSDCYNNLGFAYAQKKDYEKAVEAYKKVAELDPNNATAYAGLANAYNALRKFDLAAEASEKATELTTNLSATSGAGGSADALFNQGVISWNSGKLVEAKKQFEAALQADPNHAEAHFQLGMVLVNEGNLLDAATEFETYLTLAPTGPNTATAQALVAQLKK